MFSVAGLLGLPVTLLAMRTGAYRRRSAHDRQPDSGNAPPIGELVPAPFVGHGVGNGDDLPRAADLGVGVRGVDVVWYTGGRPGATMGRPAVERAL